MLITCMVSSLSVGLLGLVSGETTTQTPDLLATVLLLLDLLSGALSLLGQTILSEAGFICQ